LKQQARQQQLSQPQPNKALHPMVEIVNDKTGSTRLRWDYAIKDKAFDVVRGLPILETNAARFLKILSLGRAATNVHLAIAFSGF
jgi:hypothetical protein